MLSILVDMWGSLPTSSVETHKASKVAVSGTRLLMRRAVHVSPAHVSHRDATIAFFVSKSIAKYLPVVAQRGRVVGFGLCA